MTPLVPPHGLAAALRSDELTLAGPVGPGADGARWSAVDGGGRRWTVTVVQPKTPEHRSALLRRARILAATSHPHLPRWGSVIEMTSGALAVLQEEVAGTDLRTVRAARGRWEPGEVVTVVVPLAGALAALHAAGTVHGDVSPANVVLTPDGRAVLVDLLGAADGSEVGTPGFAAPERTGGASASGDVHALAQLGLDLLRLHREDSDGGATGDRADPDRARVEQCLAAATALQPTARPDAHGLAAALYAACRAVPVGLPDRAVLARAALRTLAEAAAAQRTARVPTEPRRRRGRHRKPRPRVVRVVSSVTVAGLLAGSAAAAAAWSGDRAAPVAVVRDGRDAGQAASRGVDPVVAALALTRLRANALVAGSPEEVRAVTVPGSRAAGADLAVVGAFAGSAEEAHVEVLGAARLPVGREGTGWTGRPCGRCAKVLVSARVGLGAPDDGHLAPRSVVLSLQATPGGWRVSDVRPAPAP